jgi:hypothetical protein
MGSINENEWMKIAIINSSAEMNVEDVLPMIKHLLHIRKEYARIYTSSDDWEKRHHESLHGFDFCNEEIKKLIGIL